MSLKENTGRRDLTYSQWHRPDSFGRYMPPELAFQISMIDIDCVEYVRGNSEIVMLVETSRHSASYKNAKITAQLARRAGLHAFNVRYRPSESENPFSTLTPKTADIQSFLVEKIFPLGKTNLLSIVTPLAWARFLAESREVGPEQAWLRLSANPQAYC